MITTFVSNSSSERVTTATETNLEEALLLLARHSPGGEVVEATGFARYTTGVPHPFANGVLRTRLTSSNVASEVRKILEHFKAVGLPMMWFVTPSSRPADLGKHLVAQGATRGNNNPAMSVDLDALQPIIDLPAGVEIREVDSPMMMAEWARVACEGSGIPQDVGRLFTSASDAIGLGEQVSMRYFLAYQSGIPVATSNLFLAAGVAGIYCVSTLLNARRQGLGAAITLAPLLVARDLGYRIGVLQATAMGLPLYQRLGFTECCSFDTYTYNVGE